MSLETDALRREIHELRERLDRVESLQLKDAQNLDALVGKLNTEFGDGRAESCSYNECQIRGSCTRPTACRSIESLTIAAIADWLERRADEIVEKAGGGTYTRAMADADHRAAGLTDAVDALRAGTWRHG